MQSPTWGDWIAFGAIAVGLYNAHKIQRVHISLNSRLSQLLRAAKAQGRQDERDSSHENNSD